MKKVHFCCYFVRIECLDLNPGGRRLLGRHVRASEASVGLVEAEDGVVLVVHGVADVAVPGLVRGVRPPDKGDELLISRLRAARASLTRAVMLRRLHHVVRIHVPVVPPTIQKG